jgi:hypothetical protein
VSGRLRAGTDLQRWGNQLACRHQKLVTGHGAPQIAELPFRCSRASSRAEVRVQPLPSPRALRPRGLRAGDHRKEASARSPIRVETASVAIRSGS